MDIQRSEFTLFLGTYPCAVDEENRITVLSTLGNRLGKTVFITQGFDRNLVILPAEAFLELHQRIRSLNMADPLARLLGRLILGRAQEVEIDIQGRLPLPAGLMEFAALSGRALLVGQGDYLEVWSPDHWAAQETELRDADSNAARFSMLTLSTR
jgi:MraZ protein